MSLAPTMTGRDDPARIKAVADAAQTLSTSFQKAGAEIVVLPMIQPADVFLDAVGEDLRARTYVFTDPDGHELCLRPDLTIPAAVAFLEGLKAGATGGRQLTYDGLVFRYRPPTASGANPREFRQVGLEYLGHEDAAPQIDAVMFERVVRALEATGLAGYDMQLGDLALMHAALAAAPMPRRWRDQLLAHFSEPTAFRRLLRQFSTDPGDWTRGLPDSMLDGLADLPKEAAEARVEQHLATLGLDPAATTRSVGQIAARLCSAARDRRAHPLNPNLAGAIEALLNITGTPPEAIDAFDRTAVAAGLDVTIAADGARARHALIAHAGLDIAQARFSAAFGRKIAYYSGFVFEIVVPGLGKENPVAGGGRYDRLLGLIEPGCTRAAAGAAIYVDRLVACLPPVTHRRVPITLHGQPMPGPRSVAPAGATVDAPSGGTGAGGAVTPQGTAPADRLVIAVPSKGRMMEDCLALFKRAGLEVRKVGQARGYRGDMAGQPLVDVAFVSSSEIAERLRAGEVHLGVTGEDLVRDSAPDADTIATFHAKLGFGSADVVVAVPDVWVDVRTMADLASAAHVFRQENGHRMRVATKYKTLTRAYFRRCDVEAYRIVESLGATEGAPAAGLAELIVDITSTGETLRANGLRILDDGVMLNSEANLIGAQKAARAPEIAVLEAHIVAMIRRAVQAG